MTIAITTLVRAVLLFVLPLASAQAGPTVDAALKKGFVQCGVNTGLAGFPSRTAMANGAASTSIYAARWRRPCSAMPRKFASRR